jgi:hypothetical protein
MMVIVEQLMEWRLAGETEVLGENLPQSHFVHHKSNMTRPGLQPGQPRWEAASKLCCNRNVSASFALPYSSVVMSSTSQSSGLPPLRLIREARRYNRGQETDYPLFSCLPCPSKEIPKCFKLATSTSSPVLSNSTLHSVRCSQAMNDAM